MSELDDFNEALVELAQEGKICIKIGICASGLHPEKSILFKAAKFSTEEEKEFTKLWLLDPFFEVDEC